MCYTGLPISDSCVIGLNDGYADVLDSILIVCVALLLQAKKHYVCTLQSYFVIYD